MKVLTPLLLSPLLVFAAFSSSSTYQLNNYSLGASGTNTAASSTYYLEGSAGQLVGAGTTGSTYQTNSGDQAQQQSAVPPAPTLSNGGGTYYNKLGLVVNTASGASDITYAVAVSTDNFATSQYVQVDGTLGATALYQTYAQWGAATGTVITGLSPATTYKVRVAAMQAKYTASGFGPAATASTLTPSLTFSLSGNTLALGGLAAGSITVSPSVTVGFGTNAANGGSVYLSGLNGGLKSTAANYTLASSSADLSSLASGVGAQGSNPTQTSGGPFTVASAYNLTANNVGQLNSALTPLFSSTSSVVGGSATAKLLAKAAASTPAATDYQEILTFTASASY